MGSEINAIDSCILVRVILGDNILQAKLAKDLLLSGRELYVDSVAIMETVYVLTKNGKKHDEITIQIQALLKNPMFRYDKEFFDRVFKRYEGHLSLSFDDCCLAERMIDREIKTLWTFDKKFANQVEVAKRLW